MRDPKPWFRKFDGCWYIQIAGRKVKLAKGRENRAEAVQEFHRLMAGTRPAKKHRLTAAQVCDLYLVHSEKEHEPATFSWHKTYLQPFCDTYGRFDPADLIPFHLTAWLDAHPTWKGARRHAAVIVKRAFRWAKRQGLIAADPFAEFKVEPGGRRGRVVTRDERAQILAAIKDQPFREFVTAMAETGCRPSEVCRVTAADFDPAAGVWVLRKHKTGKKTGRPRVVYLTPAMVALSKRLAAEFPDGPIFRGPRGKKPFTRNGVRCRFRRLRVKLPHLGGVVAAAYRASFATDALENGVGVAQVAELLGHTDTTMVMKHYSMLSERVGHLREMARKATGT